MFGAPLQGYRPNLGPSKVCREIGEIVVSRPHRGRGEEDQSRFLEPVFKGFHPVVDHINHTVQGPDKVAVDWLVGCLTFQQIWQCVSGMDLLR